MRYIPHTGDDVREMLETIGVSSEDALFESIPPALRAKAPLDLPPALDERALLQHLTALAGKNAGQDVRVFMGGGAYNHYIPSAINELIHRTEFYTAYTPYQPELAQGTLQAMFEYQSMICRLLGTEVSNASMYDGSTAFTEAWFMAVRQQKNKRRKLVAAGALHPEYLEVLRTYLLDCGLCLVTVPAGPDGRVDPAALAKVLDDDTAALAFQSPNFFGVLEDVPTLCKAAADRGALSVACFTEALAFGLIEPPGRQGADIVVGEGQSLGISMSYGGPGLGIMACRKDLVRNIPGRLVGETVDRHGTRGFCITLATREQHIRREKATSNICTNQGLCALTAAMYLTLLGPEGLAQVARANHANAAYLRSEVLKVPGVKATHGSSPFFNEFVVTLPTEAEPLVQRLADQKIAAGIPLSRYYAELKHELLLTATELTTAKDIQALVTALKNS
jgi:glycine dehydrogenase subunit 1